VSIDDETARVGPRAEEGRCLLVVADRRAIVWPLPTTGSVVLGRGEDVDLRIEHASVSRKHARVDVGEGLILTDLASANGTRVGGRAVAPNVPVPVEAGAVIELGAVWVVVHDASDAAAATAEAPPASAATTLAPPAAPRDLPALGPDVIVADPAMQRLHQLVEKVAPTRLSVLILGETGSGKEVVADAVHRLSPRAARPLVRLNCAAIPRTLLESELFGHERGAFTGAQNARAGLFEAAHGGTVFLDEIGELPLDVQVTLLRVLEDRKVQRLGGRETRDVDVRFVCATNRDLRAEVERGAFRSDLYYRINGVTLVVPPLRERASEIAPLARRFAERAAAEAGIRTPAIEAAAMRALETWRWPGNVRELRNVIERAVALATGSPIALEHLPSELAGAPPAASSASAPRPAGATPDLRGEIDDLERRRILDALDQCAGNQTRAAALLGMPLRTFVKRLDAYGIARPRKK
jgi:DNA-binding NtrC family response regulator